MAKLQSFKRLNIEDYDQQFRPLINKLAYSLNPFADDVLNALNKNLTLSDNLNCSVKTLTVTVDASGKPLTTTVIQSGLSAKCVGSQVINASNATVKSNSPTSQPFISFIDNNQVLTINSVTGLQANQQYQLTVIFYA